MNRVFSQLIDTRVEEAFSVLQAVGAQIQDVGRRQRITNTSLENYRDWHREKANYMVTEDEQIIGLVTMRRETLIDWPDFEKLGPVWMLRALATHPNHCGTGAGAFAVREAIKLTGNGEAIYLDCVSEFLPDYYSQFGFESIARQTRHYPDCNESYDITLMRLNSA